MIERRPRAALRAALRAAMCAIPIAIAAAGLAYAQGLESERAEVREVPIVYRVDGVVEAVRHATVAARVAGRVLEVRVDAGRAVKQGEVIARIDEREVAQQVASSEARITEAEANLANARSNFERTRKLVAEQFMSAAALDKARSDYEMAQATVEALRAEARVTATARSYATVTAPLTGIVSSRHTEAGDLAQPGKPIATIFDPRDLRVVVSVPQQRLSEVRAFAAATVEVRGRAEPIAARSVTVLPSADVRTHASDVRVVLPEESKDVYPGMAARVLFTVGTARRLVIPARAVVRRSEVTGVYVETGSGAVQFRQVRLGEATGDAAVEVLAGVQPGERVVLDPARALAILRGTAQ